MSRYKVLPLPIEFQDEYAELFYDDPWDRPKEKEMEPVFGRPGMYFDRKKDLCWVETTHGCWIVGDSRHFKREMLYRANDENILHPDVIEAFKVLDSHNLLTKELRKKWWASRDASMIRETRRGAKKWRLSIGK